MAILCGLEEGLRACDIVRDTRDTPKAKLFDTDRVRLASKRTKNRRFSKLKSLLDHLEAFFGRFLANFSESAPFGSTIADFQSFASSIGYV